MNIEQHYGVMPLIKVADDGGLLLHSANDSVVTKLRDIVVKKNSK